MKIALLYSGILIVCATFCPGQTKSDDYPRRGMQPTGSFAYDDSDNLVTRSDARVGLCVVSATSNSCDGSVGYDALNRPIQKRYTNPNTSAVVYGYDQDLRRTGDLNLNYRKGRLTSVTTGSTAVQFNRYDPLGRIAVHTQRTDAVDYVFTYAYGLGGQLTSMTYPSGRVVSTGYDNAGRPNLLLGSKSGENAVMYVEGSVPGQGVQYSPHGAMAQWKLGSGLYEQWTYDSRLQPASVRLGSSPGSGSGLGLDLGYGVNGNVLSQRISGSGLDRTQTYKYDRLNRLIDATEAGGWSWTFDHDRYGNRWVVNASGITAGSFTPRTSNWFNTQNQISNSGLPTRHDGSGNLDIIGGYQFGYDGEQRMISSSINSAVTQYAYDGNGRRVKKGATVYVYDAFGRLAAEYGSAVSDTGRRYWTTDPLGSLRATSDNGAVIARRDYMPSGEEIRPPVGGRSALWATSLGAGQRFTGKERDSETWLDYFEARYLSAEQQTFTSPDEPLIDQDESDPQSWNLYSYVRNNPLGYVDPTGRCSQDKKGGYWDADDKGTLLFTGPCANGTIGEDKPSSTVVGVGWDEARLIMLSGIGSSLSSPGAWASVARGGVEGAMAVEGGRGLLAGGFAALQNLRAFLTGTGLTELKLAGAAETANVVTSTLSRVERFKALAPGFR